MTTREEIIEAGAKAIHALTCGCEPAVLENPDYDIAEDLFAAMLPLILAGVAERLFHESYEQSLVTGESYDEDDPRKEMIARDSGTLYGLRRATELVKEWTP